MLIAQSVPVMTVAQAPRMPVASLAWAVLITAVVPKVPVVALKSTVAPGLRVMVRAPPEPRRSMVLLVPVLLASMVAEPAVRVRPLSVCERVWALLPRSWKVPEPVKVSPDELLRMVGVLVVLVSAISVPPRMVVVPS